MTQAGKKSKSGERHSGSWACSSLQPGPHAALPLPRPRARARARGGPGAGGPAGQGGLPGPAAASPGRGPAGGRPSRPAARSSRGPAGCPCLSGGGPGSSSPSARGGASRGSAGTGRGGGDTHPWWRRRRLQIPECHLRSRSCMPGARAAGTAAGLAPRGGRGLRSGPPPPAQAPAPAPPATGDCGMGRVARYIPGAPGLGPARPRRRRSASPPAKSLNPAVAPSGHRSPPQERSEKQTAGRAARPPACHSYRQPPIASASWIFAPPRLASPANHEKEIGSPRHRPPPALSQHPNSRPPANHQRHTMSQSRPLLRKANGRS